MVRMQAEQVELFMQDSSATGHEALQLSTTHLGYTPARPRGCTPQLSRCCESNSPLLGTVTGTLMDFFFLCVGHRDMLFCVSA